MTPYMKKASIKHLQLMLIDESNVLLIIVTDAGVVKNKEVHFSVKVNNEFIVKFTAILNDKLVGVTIEQIDRAMLNDIYKELGYDENVVLPVLSCIISIINEIDSADIFLGGATNIFNYPEYNQVIKAKEILSFLEEKKSLYKLFAKVYDNKEENKNKSKNKNSKISIVIGKENEFTKIKNCSVIMTNYSIGEKVIGSIGIIGPTRMEYAKVVSSLEFLTMHLNSILTKLLYEE